MAKRKKKLVHFDLWGKPIEEATPSRTGEIMPLDFEGDPLKVANKFDGVWFKAADACRIAGVKNVSDVLRRLDDDQKRDDIDSIDVVGRASKVWYVNESGLYTLLLSGRLRKDSPQYEKVKRFRRWVTDEVLTSIRRTGTYSIKSQSRVDREAKRLGCDKETAKVRCEQFVINKFSHERLAKAKAKRRHFRAWNNACYEGQFSGLDASGLRKGIGIKKGTPLDHMDQVPLSTNRHAKSLANRMILELERSGKPVPLDDQIRLIRTIAEEQSARDLVMFGPQARFGITDDPVRGKIIDIVQCQLSA